MKVLMVTSSYPKFPGDVTAPFIEEIARGIVTRGHSVDLVLPHHPELKRPATDPIRYFPYRYAPDRMSWWGYAQSMDRDVRVRRAMFLLLPLAALQLRRTLAARLEGTRYDIVHVHWVIPNAVLVADLVGSHGVPLVVSLHGSDVFVAERLSAAGRLARATFRGCGGVTAGSLDLRRRALALGAPPGRTRTVPYGVDASAFAPSRVAGDARSRLGLTDDDFMVLAFGRLVEKKGFRHLVEAAARVSGMRVVIAGEGDLHGELRALVRERAAPVGLPGALDRETLAAALGTADAVVVPSVVDRAGNVDGLPNALLEALAAGRAVVASRVAGIPDVVEDGREALLVPPGDPDALAQALTRLRDDPALRERLGSAARRKVASELSWEAAASAFEDCYRQAARAR